MDFNHGDLPYINQDTIECDLRAFTRWLNNVVDALNWTIKVYKKLDAQVATNTEEIRLLKNRMTTAEENITNLQERMTTVEDIIHDIDLDEISHLIDLVNGRIDLLYSWIPVPYGMVDPLGWKFAMGNINVMSSTNDPTATTGPGIYTSGTVEDNDINFK